MMRLFHLAPIFVLLLAVPGARIFYADAFVVAPVRAIARTTDAKLHGTPSTDTEDATSDDATLYPRRRDWLKSVVLSSLAAAASSFVLPTEPATAVGPVKVFLTPTKYSAKQCPKDKPMPGQKAMGGMRPMCVTVQADVKDSVPKDLDKVGVYGFVKDADTGDSVLANNPDLSTDAGQFTIIPLVKQGATKVEFEFVAAIPMDTDTTQYAEGISPLDFEGIRLVSFPGGEQYGAISPCEMNEFSEECEAWEEENGPYERGEFMMKRGK